MGLLGTAFGFQKFEKQFMKQQQVIILQQSLAGEDAAHNSRLQMSVLQHRGEQHWDDEILHWAGDNAREIRRVAYETSK